MVKLLISSCLLTTLALAGCSRGLFSVHKIVIQQGNALEPAAVARITPGLRRVEVRRILGTPVLVPLFNPNRWDYYYFIKRPDEPAEQRLLSVYFEQDRVVRVQKRGLDEGGSG